ncbi:MAG: aromatic ring-hydroxylating dioxygenase subunit alpha [Paracoccaceae bacterium]|nr:aromatic ring-hydroxylating dioxygenase subunit alpha [Paracoccaceae bacterium]
MTRTDDPVALNEWYAVASLDEPGAAPQTTRLLGEDIEIGPGGGVRSLATGEALRTCEKWGLLFASFGRPPRALFDIAEARETDRRFVPCGWITLRASGLRVVENFLDMAHFPFIHTGILGTEPHTEVPQYASEIRRDVDEVWATNCTFFQSQIAATETGGDFVHLTYRVPAPFVVMLYRVCPSAPDRLDAIALFLQPMEETLCRAIPLMWLVDTSSTHAELLRFEQVIFMQDRIVVENQRPLRLPLEPRHEIPTRADGSSVAYRRWLKEKGLRFGTTAGAEAAA